VTYVAKLFNSHNKQHERYWAWWHSYSVTGRTGKAVAWCSEGILFELWSNYGVCVFLSHFKHVLRFTLKQTKSIIANETCSSLQNFAVFCEYTPSRCARRGVLLQEILNLYLPFLVLCRRTFVFVLYNTIKQELQHFQSHPFTYINACSDVPAGSRT
jgi:hypothetical protein